MQIASTSVTQATLSSMTWPRRLAQILLGVAIIIMIAHVVIYMAFGVALIPFPFDYDQAEGFELNNAILLANGGCPYCDNDVFPFYASGYAPFFHMLMVPFVWLFGPQFWYGRLLIFIATLITAGAIAYAIHRSERHRWIALLAGMAFLASNYIYHIGPLLRQHLLMVMFETLAVVLVATAFDYQGKQRRWRLLATFTLLLLAGYTKQLAYTTCIAVALWVFLRNPRTAILYSIGLIVVAAAIFAGWMLITDGHWWLNIIRSNQNPYITEQFTGLLSQFVRLHWPLLLLSGLLVLYELYFSRLSIYSIWFVISLASTVGAGKWGAGDSYFATTIVAACILSGIVLARSWQQNWQLPDNYITRLWPKNLNQAATRTMPIFTLVATGLFIIYGLTVIKMPTSGPIFGPLAQTLNIEPAPGHRYPLYDAAGWTVGYAVTGHFPSPEDYQNGWQIVEQVREAEGYVMSEDAGFSIQAGREVITNAVQLNNLWQLNTPDDTPVYDPTNLITMIETQQFGLVILRARFFPPPVMIAIQEHYALSNTIPMNGFQYELWTPRSNTNDGVSS